MSNTRVGNLTFGAVAMKIWKQPVLATCDITLTRKYILLQVLSNCSFSSHRVHQIVPPWPKILIIKEVWRPVGKEPVSIPHRPFASYLLQLSHWATSRVSLSPHSSHKKIKCWGPGPKSSMFEFPLCNRKLWLFDPREFKDSFCLVDGPWIYLLQLSRYIPFQTLKLGPKCTKTVKWPKITLWVKNGSQGGKLFFI